MGPVVVLAVLAIAVILAGAWAMTGRQVSNDKAELVRADQDATAAEARVASLAPYKEFAALSKARKETVRGLIDGRFDWSAGLREVARVLPADVDLISLVGTTSPNSSVQGAGAGGSARSALPDPAIDLIGCAKSQSRVASLLARLRAIDGVERVSLTSSEKSDSASVSATDCRSNVHMPQFQLTVFFHAPAGIVAATAASTTAPVAAQPPVPSGGAK
jgi:Tfp pilus assembly protein PilN